MENLLVYENEYNLKYKYWYVEYDGNLKIYLIIFYIIYSLKFNLRKFNNTKGHSLIYFVSTLKKWTQLLFWFTQSKPAINLFVSSLYSKSKKIHWKNIIQPFSLQIIISFQIKCLHFIQLLNKIKLLYIIKK